MTRYRRPSIPIEWMDGQTELIVNDFGNSWYGLPYEIPVS